MASGFFPVAGVVARAAFLATADFFAGAAFLGAAFLGADFLTGADFLAADFFAGAAFFGVVRAADAFFDADFLAAITTS